MIGVHFLGYFFLACSLCVFVLLVVGAAVSIHLVVASLGCQLASPRVPQGRPEEAKCTILYNKINDFAMPPVSQKRPLRVPLGPPKAALRPSEVPQRAPQSPPKGTPGAFGGALAPKRSAQGIPMSTFDPRRPLNEPQLALRVTQGRPKELKPTQDPPVDPPGPPKPAHHPPKFTL